MIHTEVLMKKGQACDQGLLTLRDAFEEGKTMAGEHFFDGGNGLAVTRTTPRSCASTRKPAGFGRTYFVRNLTQKANMLLASIDGLLSDTIVAIFRPVSTMRSPSEWTAITRRQSCFALAGLAFATLTALAHAQLPDFTKLVVKKRANARNRADSQSAKSKKKDERIEALIAKIDSARLTDTLKALTSIPTRWSSSPELAKARDFIMKQFVDFGYDAGRVQLVELKLPNGTIAHNVLCSPERLDQGFILIGAHYDAISEMSAVSAPGADDDGSGIAVVLEIARIFAGVSLKRSVMFAAFAGEEQGLFGSQAVANLAANDKWAIDVMVNLDMIAHVDPERLTNIVVEYDQGNVDPRNDAAAKAFGLLMAQLAADYTGMTVEHTDIWSSDYMPFEAKGFPCIGLYDGAADASFYHTTQDKIGQVDLARLTEVIALVCAFVATTAELASS
jgi:hypothetical protein